MKNPWLINQKLTELGKELTLEFVGKKVFFLAQDVIWKRAAELANTYKLKEKILLIATYTSDERIIRIVAKIDKLAGEKLCP